MINKYFKSNEIDLVKIINDNFIFIKDNKILFIDTNLNSKLIEKKKKKILNVILILEHLILNAMRI